MTTRALSDRDFARALRVRRGEPVAPAGVHHVGDSWTRAILNVLKIHRAFVGTAPPVEVVGSFWAREYPLVLPLRAEHTHVHVEIARSVATESYFGSQRFATHAGGHEWVLDFGVLGAEGASPVIHATSANLNRGTEIAWVARDGIVLFAIDVAALASFISGVPEDARPGSFVMRTKTALQTALQKPLVRAAGLSVVVPETIPPDDALSPLPCVNVYFNIGSKRCRVVLDL